MENHRFNRFIVSTSYFIKTYNLQKTYSCENTHFKYFKKDYIIMLLKFFTKGFLYPTNENATENFVMQRREFGTWIMYADTYKNKPIKCLKTSLKNNKNICIKSLFSSFFRYAYNLHTKIMDLPAFNAGFSGLVYAKVCSHVDVNLNIRRYMK